MRRQYHPLLLLLLLTHHYVLGDGLQHHLLIHVFHQQELGEVLKDELFEAGQLLRMAGQI